MTRKKPDKQKELEGTYRSDRVNGSAVKPLKSLPAIPQYLSSYAEFLYNKVGRHMLKYGMLNNGNWQLFCDYCQESWKYVEAEEFFQSQSRFIEVFDSNNNKKIVRHPRDRAASEYLNNARKQANELRLTAVIVDALPKDEHNPFANLLK